MKRILLLLMTAAVYGASCKKCEDHESVPNLTGTWQEVEQEAQFAGDTYRITFNSDGTFRLWKQLFTDIIQPVPQPCSNGRTQYARGHYAISDRLLTLNGLYTDSTFATDRADCEKGAYFEEQHTLTDDGGEYLILDAEREKHYRIHLKRQ